MEKIELLLIMVTNTKNLKLHRGNHDLSSIYHILSKFQAYQGLIWQASKLSKIFFDFSFSNNGFHNICKPYSFHCKTLALG